MKKLLLICCVVLFASCEAEGELTRNAVGAAPISEESVLLASGNFVPQPGISATGRASIYQDMAVNTVALEEFSVSSAPDLKVYLSTTSGVSNFVNLGALGSGTTQAYAVPEVVNVSNYSHVIIYCQQFKKIYAVAELQLN